MKDGSALVVSDGTSVLVEAVVHVQIMTQPPLVTAAFVFLICLST